MPENWLHKPTSIEIKKFKEVSETHQKTAKKVRQTLVGIWLKEVQEESGCTVTRLNDLRLTRHNENLWPCPKCKSNCECIFSRFVLLFSMILLFSVGEDGPGCEHSPLVLPPTKSPYDFCPQGN